MFGEDETSGVLASRLEVHVLELYRSVLRNERSWGPRNRETGLSFLFKLHRSLSHHSCAYRIARIWACPPPIWGGLHSVPSQRKTRKTRTVHKSSDSLRLTRIRRGCGKGKGWMDLGFRHPSPVQPVFPIPLLKTVLWEIEGLSIYRTTGPRRGGRVVVDVVQAIIGFIILIWGRTRKCFCWDVHG